MSNEEKEEIELERDLTWLSIMELYVPEVREVYEAEGSTLENIISAFVSAIKDDDKRKKNKKYGVFELVMP